MKKFLLLVAFAISCFFVYSLNANASNLGTVQLFGHGSSYYSYPLNVGSFNNIQNGTWDLAVVWSDYNVEPGKPSQIDLEFSTTDTYFNMYVFSQTNFCNLTYKVSNLAYRGQYSNVYKVIVSISSTQALGGSSGADRECHFQFSTYDWRRFMYLGETTDTNVDIGPDYTPLVNAQNSTNEKLDSVKQEQEKTNQKLDKTNEELGELNDSIGNDNTDEASGAASEFFSGFETDTFGLTSIITAPLNLIGSITSSSCSPLGLNVPFVNSTLNLPCMTNIYERYFGSFLDVYQTITFGIIAYWVCIRIFALVKDFKNPDHDEIEVMDL